MKETRVWSPSLEKEMATHSSILAWETPWTEETGRLQSMGSLKVGHDLANEHEMFIYAEEQHKTWNPTTTKDRVHVSHSVVLTICDPTDCNPPGCSVHGILQARILEWVVIPFFRGSSWHNDQTQVFCIARRFFTVWATQAPWVKKRFCQKEAVTLITGHLASTGYRV